MQKQLHRVFTIFLLAFFGLISSLTIQLFSPQRVIGVKPQTGEMRCLPNLSPEDLSPEDLSVRGKANYELGRFDEAINCWQKSVAAYRQQKNEAEAINNQINQAQAAFAMGLYPRACNILLPIYGDKDCTLLTQDQKKRKQYSEKLEKPEGLIKLLNTPAKIAGLRILANVFRGLGELDWSYQILVLLANNNNSLPEQTGAIWLDLGNTLRTLSNREQDYYNRTEQQENFNCALTYASVANSVYQQALGYINKTSDTSTLMQIQAQLNQVTLVENLTSWRETIMKNMKSGSANRICNEWNGKIITKNTPRLFGRDEFQSDDENIFEKVRQLVTQYVGIPSQQIDNLQQQIEQLPKSHAALFIRLNFAKNLIRLNRFSKVEDFLKKTIKQATDIGDLKVESYGYGYLGELHEKRTQWKLAKDNTQKALFIAQSLSTGASPSEIEYLWEWQLGRIYKSQLPPREQAQSKGIKQESLKNLDDARQMYQEAYLTLQSLRTELVAGNPDAELSFQNDIEDIYRDYVNLLLWDSKPPQKNLSKAREVIASLQAVELENFLRLACPEFNIEKIDEIIDKPVKDKQPVKTAFFYPILVEDRIEVIIKLPNQSNPKSQAKEEQKNYSIPNLIHYSTPVDEDTIKEEITRRQIDLKEYTFNAVLKKLQLDLEEEYTFEDVKKEAKLVYDWLLKGAEQYLKGIDILVFALDTNLRNIPLAALVVDDKEKTPKYLIDNYALALAPRLDIRKPNTLQRKGLKILAAGLKESEINSEQKKYPKLNYVEKEIKAIEEIPNSNFSVSELIDQDFKIEKLKKEIDTSAFKILHLATHGEFSSSPEKTFLLATDEPININQIGDIFQKQAQRQPEPIEILVLSACETAAGDKRATLGISGVGVRAGARSSIASLWTLDDEISVDFTKIFYRQLIDPKVTTKAQALQQTQKQLKDLPGREHPRYWASYILLGNWL
ncbi:CHAT domain-containing protein [Scytonema sp. PRP1]|uniref:CHAT domain-containing protein n=1 Tax=Scytonema sp. PRP1 TaxID=3120513 RepID=UPI002FCE9C4C